MPRVHAHLRERALGMLQRGMKTADVARAINCNVHTVRHLRTSQLQDRYRMATTTARVTPGTHNPSISAQTVRNRLREAGLRACRPVVVRQVLTRHHRQQRCLRAQLTVAGLDRTGKKCSSPTSRGFVSPEVMVGFAFIVEGMSITPRPVL